MSSLIADVAGSAANPMELSCGALLVCDAGGVYRPATADEVLRHARLVLAKRVRRGVTFDSPALVKDYLRVHLSPLEHEVFAVIFLDAQHRLIACEQMFRGTLSQTSVYPREVVKRALVHNCAAVVLAHSVARHRMRLMCPESLCANPCRRSRPPPEPWISRPQKWGLAPLAAVQGADGDRWLSR
jgi:DNA repair protein RadC